MGGRRGKPTAKTPSAPGRLASPPSCPTVAGASRKLGRNLLGGDGSARVCCSLACSGCWARASSSKVSNSCGLCLPTASISSQTRLLLYQACETTAGCSRTQILTTRRLGAWPKTAPHSTCGVLLRVSCAAFGPKGSTLHHVSAASSGPVKFEMLPGTAAVPALSIQSSQRDQPSNESNCGVNGVLFGRTVG